MTTTPLTPKGLNSWKTTSTIVACARFAASISAPFTDSTLLMASRSQSNNSRSRYRPKAFNRASLLSSPIIYRTSPATFSLGAVAFRGKNLAATQKLIHCRGAILRLQEKNTSPPEIWRRRRRCARRSFRLHWCGTHFTVTTDSRSARDPRASRREANDNLRWEERADDESGHPGGGHGGTRGRRHHPQCLRQRASRRRHREYQSPQGLQHSSPRGPRGRASEDQAGRADPDGLRRHDQRDARRDHRRRGRLRGPRRSREERRHH